MSDTIGAPRVLVEPVVEVIRQVGARAQPWLVWELINVDLNVIQLKTITSLNKK